jgi:CDP-diacylglycerol--serine O-phosphatidyltransferase
MRHSATNRRFRRGIYLLPTVFTVGNLFCGYSSIVHSARETFDLAALLIIVAAVLDGLDGRIARLTGSTSAFGLQFDSLADVVSFGIAPACLAYHWSLTPLHRAGWLIAFLFVVSASMRLARFNLQHAAVDKKFFVGLPSPVAAGAVASLAFAFPQLPEARWVSPLLAAVVVGVALLMISRFRYRSFKDLDLRNRRSYVQVLPIAALLIGVLANPVVLLALAGSYILSAPAAYLWGAVRRGRRHPRSRFGDRDAAEVIDGHAFR